MGVVTTAKILRLLIRRSRAKSTSLARPQRSPSKSDPAATLTPPIKANHTDGDGRDEAVGRQLRHE
jgi:hypothetical protein